MTDERWVLNQDNIALFATSDRAATADLVLQLAVKEAIGLLRADRPMRARLTLARAQASARRILGS